MSATQHTTRARRVVAAMATLGALAGLFGMHVLGLHGVQHEHAVSSGAAETHNHAATGTALGVASAHMHGTDRTADAAPVCCDDDYGMSVLMLCVALLVATVLLTALVARTLRRGSGRARARTRTPWVTFLSRASPPYTMAFSVIRC